MWRRFWGGGGRCRILIVVCCRCGMRGSGADLIKIAMVNVYRRMKKEGWKSKMLLQVHDELVFETLEEVAEKEAEMIREEMTGAMKLKVPLKVEVGWGKNWQEGK